MTDSLLAPFLQLPGAFRTAFICPHTHPSLRTLLLVIRGQFGSARVNTAWKSGAPVPPWMLSAHLSRGCEAVEAPSPPSQDAWAAAEGRAAALFQAEQAERATLFL